MEGRRGDGESERWNHLDLDPMVENLSAPNKRNTQVLSRHPFIILEKLYIYIYISFSLAHLVGDVGVHPNHPDSSSLWLGFRCLFLINLN